MRYLMKLLVLAALLFQSGYQVSVGQVDISQLPKVTVYVNVDDASGSPVTNLTREDFSITEDGNPVKLTDFAGEGDARPVDIVFVFDTTGSMGGEIKGVIETSVKFANELASQGRDYRLGLVTFGDAVRGTYNTDGSLTADVNEFKGWVQSLKANGGDNDPENTYGALKAATRLNFRPDSQIIFILITDAPAHVSGDYPEPEGGFDDPDLNITRALEQLRDPRAVTVYPVTLEDANFHRLADETGGTFYLLSSDVDFTGIIRTIGRTIATQYRLTYTTPRAVDDGTRRNIEVTIGESTGSTRYMEPHLINVQSNLLVGLACLFPLLLGLMVPFGWMAITKPRKVQLPSQQAFLYPPTAVPQPPASPPASPSVTAPGLPPQMPFQAVSPSADNSASQPSVAPASEQNCAYCGASIRQGAKFCPACGKAQPYCANCGAPLRAGARFCGKCGMQQPQ